MESSRCNCCGFSFSEVNRGTEKNGSKSTYYCEECYDKGAFVQKKYSIVDMEKKLLKMARCHKNVELIEAQHIIRILPKLKRWEKTHIL